MSTHSFGCLQVPHRWVARQRAPVAVMTPILKAEPKLPKRKRRSTQRLVESLSGSGYEGAHDSVRRFVQANALHPSAYGRAMA